MEVRSSSSNCGNTFGSGLTLASLRSVSHWPAKFCTNAADFGSASIRLTCASRFFRSPPFAANANSSSSGMLLQRKYESRLASSYSLTG